jgi:hypothetical protein
MQRVLVAARTILLPLHALRVQSLVLVREVVAVFALVAREDDLLSGHFLVVPVLGISGSAVRLHAG